MKTTFKIIAKAIFGAKSGLCLKFHIQISFDNSVKLICEIQYWLSTNWMCTSYTLIFLSSSVNALIQSLVNCTKLATSADVNSCIAVNPLKLNSLAILRIFSSRLTIVYWWSWGRMHGHKQQVNKHKDQVSLNLFCS